MYTGHTPLAEGHSRHDSGEEREHSSNGGKGEEFLGENNAFSVSIFSKHPYSSISRVHK